MSEALAAPIQDQPREATAGLAFDRLYRESRDDVYAYAAGMLRDSAAAEEVTATAFERAYRKRARFNPARGSARAWLFGIARNAALDELRRRGRQAKLGDGDLADLSAADPSERSELRTHPRDRCWGRSRVPCRYRPAGPDPSAHLAGPPNLDAPASPPRPRLIVCAV